MSLFKKEKTTEQNENINKNMLNIPLLDLRHYSPAALKNIKLLNAATVIFPEEPSEELMEVYGGIPRKNVAEELFLDKCSQFHSINGAGVLDCSKCCDGDLYTVNGLAVILNAKEKPINLQINGMAVYENGAQLHFLTCNGKTIVVDFEIKSVKILADTASVDKGFVENLEEGTVVLCSNALTLEIDITPNLLKGRKLFFASGKNIKCSKRSLGIIQSMSAASRYKTFL